MDNTSSTAEQSTTPDARLILSALLATPLIQATPFLQSRESRQIS